MNQVLSFTQIHSPTRILLLLGSGQVVSLCLIAVPGILREPQRKLKPNEPMPNQLPNREFESHIRTILSADVSQPILKLNTSTEPAPKDSLELLMHAVKILSEKYSPKLNKARTEIDKRVTHLLLLKEQHKQEVAQLRKEKDKKFRLTERLKLKKSIL